MDRSTAMKPHHSRTLGAIAVLSFAASGACGVDGDRPGVAREVAPLTTTVFPLKPSANGRYLVDQAGTPFFMFGDAAQSGDAAVTYSQWQSYIDKRVSQGFNTVNVNLMEHKYAQAPPRDRSGNLPWTTKIGGGAYTGLSDMPDFSTANDAYWAGLEQKIAYAQSKGVLVSLAFYLGFGGGSSSEGWIDELNANTPATCTSFGTYLANGHGSFGGFKKYANVMWVWGADNFLLPGGTGSTNLLAIASAIKAAGSTQLMSADWGHGLLATDQADFTTYMDLESAYSYGQAEIVGNSRSGYSYNPSTTSGDGRALSALPTFMKETGYENENHTPTEVRGFQWWSVLSGCIAGYWFGNRDTWPFADPAGGYDPPLFAPHNEWTDAVGVTGGAGSTGTQDMARFVTFWSGLAWWKLAPSGTASPFVGRVLVTGGNDTIAGGTVAAAQASDGSLLVAYTPSTSFSVDLRSMASGQIQARWWDPTSGTFSTIGTTSKSQSAYSVTTPGTNSAGATDWVLVLTLGATNAAPTVASAATASPNPVAGTTTNLSVLGADDGGEANLTYTWAAVGTPLAPVTFSVSGTNTAKNTTATFAAAGSYSLQVTMRDSGGLTATSAVTVTVNQTATRVAVSPTSATAPAGGTQQFTGTEYDQFGRTMATQPAFVWTVSGGGTISATGLFTAGSAAGGPFTVTAAVGGLAGTASVTASTASTARYQVNSGGPGAGTFSADQLFSGGSTYAMTGAIDVSGVTNPAPVAVYQTERYGNFSYTFGGLTPGAAYVVRLHFAEIYWTAAGSRLFNVSINEVQVLTNFDIFATAGGANRALIEAFNATATASGQIVIQYTTVMDNAKSSGIEILGGALANAAPTVASPAAASPNPVTGTSTSLSVLGADDGGETNLVYTWSAVGTPPAPVTFSANGTNAAKNTTATFGAVGGYTLQATVKDAQGLTATSAVAVTVSQAATSITVSPASATVLTGATQQFKGSAFDQFGQALSTQPTFAWLVSGGGTIDATGLFTAGNTAGGPFTVTASAGLLAGKASLTVAASSTPRYQVNGGGAAAGTFSADELFSAGSTYGTTSAIDVSAVSNPAPTAVYQTERYGNFSYTFGGLTPGAAYVVRLHFAENWWTTAGSRLFNVAIGGVQVLTNFDIFATAGGANRALVEAFTAFADGGGQIAVQFTTVKDNAKVSGIEILGP